VLLDPSKIGNKFSLANENMGGMGEGSATRAIALLGLKK
jgi:hypothetical protein